MKSFYLYRSVLTLVLAITASGALWADAAIGNFNPERDLFIPQFDSKTDVDDVHSVAGVATMLKAPQLADVNYHAVAGAYGIQEGLYVPSPELFKLAFGTSWSDAHQDHEQAVEEVAQRVSETLLNGGHVWVAEAGQSDFTADWLQQVRESHPSIETSMYVHVVQHSDWNGSVTSPDKLAYVRQYANYHKIADGNDIGNGTPGFKAESDQLWAQAMGSDRVGNIWRMARSIADQYNGAEERYNNETIAAGGMDFSDVSESCWIFGYEGLHDAEAFFQEFLEAK